MRYEVEQKHRVSDVGALVKRLTDHGARFGETIQQSDQYFAHPCRDFAKTDEALRIRTVGNASFVTYKGPKLDTTTKTRHEIELPLSSSDADGSQFAELLAALGFRPVATVRKHRRKFELRVAEQSVEGALDEVDGLGSYVELELIADAASLGTAKRTITQLGSDLNLGPSERRSYLELLLEKRSQP
jgi:adenylate cyclase class 2